MTKLEPEPFGRISAGLDYPMVVVTCEVDGERSGCLVGFASQCSIHPPLSMVWVSQLNHTHRLALRAGHLGVHFLSRDDMELARLFGSTTGDEVDKFACCRWSRGPEGVPALTDCARWAVAEVVERMATGDHTGLLVRFGPGVCRPWPGQLGFQAVHDLPPGHPA
ncbi:MAG TPA: flavin reductase family protein [Acidimicrobiales bacterium]|nr:flavin reductase family protein [Acidimicrobiales bacterium]